MCIHVCVCVERGGGGGRMCLCVCKRVCDIIGKVWVGGVCVSEHVCCVSLQSDHWRDKVCHVHIAHCLDCNVFVCCLCKRKKNKQQKALLQPN